MATEFTCDAFEEIVFNIDGLEFIYSECQVMSEIEHKRFPNVEMVIKSPNGEFAEIVVTSHDKAVGKSNIVRGTYDGGVLDEDVAIGLSKLAKASQQI